MFACLPDVDDDANTLSVTRNLIGCFGCREWLSRAVWLKLRRQANYDSMNKRRTRGVFEPAVAVCIESPLVTWLSHPAGDKACLSNASWR